MPPEPVTLFGLALLGGAVALDGASVGQFMVSRPLVAATLAGWVAGDPVAGAVVGVVLEVFQLSVLPIGAARYPEGGPAAVAAAGAYAGVSSSAAALLTVVVFALAWEWVSGRSVERLRHFNVRFVPTGAPPGRLAERLVRNHLLAIGLDFVRGALLVVLGLWVCGLLLGEAVPAWSVGGHAARSALAVSLAAALASTARLFNPPVVRQFLVGAGIGLLFVLLR